MARRATHGWLWALVVAAALPAGAPANASDLYTMRTVTSGTAEPRRAIGFAQCFRDVLVRVSGDQRLLDEPLVAEQASHAGDLVASYSFRDRLAGIPIHDEQGSYDRPHDLACVFDPAKLDAFLERLGRKPWLVRPRLVAAIAIRDMKGAEYLLASDSRGGRDEDMRAALAAAADRLALPLVLPSLQQLSRAGIVADGTASDGRLGALATSAGTDLALSGKMVWSDAALGWVADWRLASSGTVRHWEIRGVGFDDAFRDGVAGAAQVLSGNGEP
ncbi:DUF2066 domain-containing protein [Mesorhizobium sp. ANAO-SY3R2]|uniref:DUF2066 domain-containing protein n=1 Tax=Mesorhizobium sp. ANAO-SY3R2 TaxID=3166644 RepID=UPI0036729481